MPEPKKDAHHVSKEAVLVPLGLRDAILRPRGDEIAAVDTPHGADAERGAVTLTSEDRLLAPEIAVLVDLIEKEVNRREDDAGRQLAGDGRGEGDRHLFDDILRELSSQQLLERTV